MTNPDTNPYQLIKKNIYHLDYLRTEDERLDEEINISRRKFLRTSLPALVLGYAALVKGISEFGTAGKLREEITGECPSASEVAKLEGILEGVQEMAGIDGETYNEQKVIDRKENTFLETKNVYELCQKTEGGLTEGIIYSVGGVLFTGTAGYLGYDFINNTREQRKIRKELNSVDIFKLAA